MPLGVKIVELTEAGSQVVDTDFTPVCGIVFSYGKTSNSLTPSANLSHCVGFFDATGLVSGAIISNDNVATSEVGRSSRGTSGGETLSTTASVVASTGLITAITVGASSVTFQWSTSGSAEKYVAIIFGGGGVDAYVGTWVPSASVTTDSITDPGFRGDAVFMNIVHLSAADDDFSAADLQFDWCFGCATSASAQWLVSTTGIDGVAGATSFRYQRTNHCMAINSNGPLFEAAFAGFTDTGFDMTIDTSGGFQPRVHYLVIKGVTALCHSFDCPTTATAQSITGLGFQPLAHIFASFGNAADTSPVTQAFWSLGWAMSATEVGWAAMLMNTGINPTACDSGGSVVVPGTDCFRTYGYAKSVNVTLRDAATFTSNGSDGFSLNWGTSAGTARQILCVSLGDKPTVIIPGGIVPGGIVP